MKDGLAVLGLVILVVLVVLVYPVLYFIGGALFGWIMANVFPFAGQWLVDGVRLLGLELNPNNLPLFTATISFIGYFFKSSTTVKK